MTLIGHLLHMNLHFGPARKPRGLTIAVLGLGVILSGLLAANDGAVGQDQPASVAGAWALTIEGRDGRCVWRGRIGLRQHAGRISGAGWARPKNRGRRCPDLKGKVEGEVEGRVVRFGFATGRLGTAQFEGRLAAGRRVMRGHWDAGRASGVWSARRGR